MGLIPGDLGSDGTRAFGYHDGGDGVNPKDKKTYDCQHLPEIPCCRSWVMGQMIRLTTPMPFGGAAMSMDTVEVIWGYSD